MLNSWNRIHRSKRAVRLFNTLLTRFLSSVWTFLPNEYVTILTPLTRGQRYLSLFLVPLPRLFGQPCIEFTWLLLCSLFRIMSPSKIYSSREYPFLPSLPLTFEKDRLLLCFSKAQLDRLLCRRFFLVLSPSFSHCRVWTFFVRFSVCLLLFFLRPHLDVFAFLDMFRNFEPIFVILEGCLLESKANLQISSMSQPRCFNWRIPFPVKQKDVFFGRPVK